MIFYEILQFCVTATILICGIYFLFKSKFLPFRKIIDTLDLFRHSENEDGISPFQAFATSIAGTIGVGNIIGVATAIYIGGSGTVFWIWISAILSMTIKYAEIFLAVNNKGSKFSGAFSYLSKVYKNPLLKTYAFFGILVSIFMGNIIQINAAAQNFKEVFNIPPILCGAVVFLICLFPLIGNNKKIFTFLGIIVPIMGFLFLSGSIIILYVYRETLPQCIYDIFKNAFTPSAIFGVALYKGFCVGLLSNEAGLGSAAFAHYEATGKNAAKEGLWGIFEVFIDSVLISTITAFIVLTAKKNTMLDSFIDCFGIWGGAFCSVCVFLFALSSVLSWSFYGKTCASFLSKKIKQGYVVFSLVCMILGGIFNMNTAWLIAEICNGFMLLLNLYGVFRLRNQILYDFPGTNKSRNRWHK